MGKISNYVRVLKAKLQDVFVVDSTDNNVTSTKSVTVEQIGDAICGEQVHSDLKTDNQTIIGGINELAKDKNIADEYDDTHTYNTGDVTIYGNTLYICTTNNTTGTFDPSKWTATTIDNVIGDLSQLTTSDKSSLVGAVNELDSDLSNLPTEIRCGIGNYSGLKGGGHPNRVNVPITFSTPMTGTQYSVFIVIADAYSDYPYVQGYCFSGSRTANGFTATILSMSSDTTTEISGSFYWVAVRYK